MFFDENQILPKVFKEFDKFLESSEKILIAVSGGVDSVFLSICLYRYFVENGYNIENIYCVTIDHQLREMSQYDANFTKQTLTRIGFKNIEILQWKHEEISVNIEELAREARYKLITEFCKKNNILKVLLGHHLDDQIETFFINLFRGSGSVGLAGMQQLLIKNDISYIRPLLKIRKIDIISFMQLNQITWVEDETNQDDKFTRNKIRKMLTLFDIDDTVAQRIGNSMLALQEGNQIIEKHIEKFIKQEDRYFYLSINEIKQLSKCEMIHIFYKIYKNLDAKKPRYEQIENILSLINFDNQQSNEIVTRKVHLSNVDIIIANNEIKFQKV